MRYALQRLGQFILVFLVVTFLVMVITRVGSKDPARDLAGGLVAQEQVDEVRELYRLDEPFVVQYGHWLKNLVNDARLGKIGRVVNPHIFASRHAPNRPAKLGLVRYTRIPQNNA